MAQLSPEEKERRRKNREAKQKKEKRAWILGILASILLISTPFIAENWDDITDTVGDWFLGKTSKSVQKLIEQGDYAKAREKAYYSSDKELITNAQVSDLIGQGEFDLAAQISSEDHNLGAYFFGVIDHLAKIYTDQGEGKLLYAMSLLSFPDPKHYTSTMEGWSRVQYGSEIIRNSNTKIESFCDYLKSAENSKLIPQMLAYLKPTTEGGDLDYSEVKRIKAKFGVK